MRTRFIYALSTLALVFTGCAKEVVDLTGEINGKKVNGAAHWGGPYILFTDASLGCQEISWVQANYGKESQYDLATDDSFAALQVYYTSSDVVEGTSQFPPNDAIFIESDRGDGTITSEHTTTQPSGSVDVEIDGEWLIGEIDVDFGTNGTIVGSFEIKKCINLK